MPQRRTVCRSIGRNTEILHQQSDQDDGREPGEYPVGQQLVARLEDEPTEAAWPELTPNTSSAAISVRHANAQPISSPARIAGKAAGSRKYLEDVARAAQRVVAPDQS